MFLFAIKFNNDIIWTLTYHLGEASLLTSKKKFNLILWCTR